MELIRTGPALRLPAVQALLIQAAALVLVLLMGYGLSALSSMQMTPFVAAFGQGVIAAAISRWRRLAPWWLPIQFLFPVGLNALLAVQLPSWIFLAAFVAMLCLYWTTFRTQVPFYPSSPSAWNAVADLLPANKALRFIDIGSGLGGLVLQLSRVRPESRFTGIEIAPLPWLISLMRACASRSQARFLRGDYTRLSFTDFDVVFAYLSPAAMTALWTKAQREMRPGTLLLSYEFAILDATPDIVMQARENGPALYGWRI